MRSSAIAAALLLAAVDDVSGQGGARTITGTVVDSASRKPVSQAVIYLGRVPTEQRTGKDGTFRVSGVADAPAVLVVRRAGYVPIVIAISEGVAGGETDLGTASMRRLRTDADRAAARDADVSVYPELAQFYDHQATYRHGLFLALDELQRIGGSLFSFIRQKPGFRYICTVTRRGDMDCGQEASRGPTSIMTPNPTSREQEPCVMTVWTNGLGPQRTLDEIQMDDVLAVEAYPNPGVTPMQFAGSPCATIMLWMKESAPPTQLR